MVWVGDHKACEIPTSGFCQLWHLQPQGSGLVSLEEKGKGEGRLGIKIWNYGTGLL